MSWNQLLGSLWIFAATGLFCAPSKETPINQLTPAEKKAGFVLLFNGRDLSNWIVMGRKEGWVVKEGVLHSDGEKGGYWLRSQRQYSDFILKLDWRVSPGGNSGVFIRCPEKGDPWVTGIEVQISNEQPPRDDMHCTGALYGLVAVKLRPDESPNRWHQFEIRCLGKRITVIVDGKVCVNADMDKELRLKDKPLKGYIGLQDSHAGAGSFVEFRNIKIKDLSPLPGPDNVPPKGFIALFNGRDLTGWKADEEAKKHWVVREGIIDYDGKGADLWTETEFGDFILMVDWRWSGEPVEQEHPVILPSGDYEMTPEGKMKTVKVLDAGDSGIYLRGSSKSQINIWCWPCGSGEIYGYRTDQNQPPEVRRGATPKAKADNPIGEWNAFVITVKDDRVKVVLNGIEVIPEAWLPGMPPKGPIALQHHGAPIQFKNIFIKDLGLQ